MVNGDESSPFVKTWTVPHHLPCVMMHSFFSSPWRHNYFLSANTRISAETPRPSLPADLFTRPLPREVASYHILSSSKAQSPKYFSALVCRCVCISMTQDPGNVSASVQKNRSQDAAVCVSFHFFCSARCACSPQPCTSAFQQGTGWEGSTA